jgi:hypothetical protein
MVADSLSAWGTCTLQRPVPEPIARLESPQLENPPMKPTVIALGALALVAVPALAAKRIQMETTDLVKNQTTTREILIDATRLRTDDGDHRTIFLTDGGNRLLMLDKSRNEYRVMDQQAMDQMGAQMQGATAQMDEAMKGMSPEQRAMMEKMMKGRMPGGAAPAPSATVFTARGSGSAAGFACTKYEGVRDGQKVLELCAADAAALKLASGDYQVYEKMREFTASMMKAMKNSPMAGMMQGSSQGGVKGFPVEETGFRDGKPVTKVVVKSITDVAVTDADFSTGAAKKVEMGMPGGRGMPPR